MPATRAPRTPPDLARALRGRGEAVRHFRSFPPSVRRGIIGWIGEARRPETRAKRIAETARLAAMKIPINNWRW